MLFNVVFVFFVVFIVFVFVVGIVVSLLQWAFYVNLKASFIANPRDLYKKKARS